MVSFFRQVEPKIFNKETQQYEDNSLKDSIYMGALRDNKEYPKGLYYLYATGAFYGYYDQGWHIRDDDPKFKFEYENKFYFRNEIKTGEECRDILISGELWK